MKLPRIIAILAACTVAGAIGSHGQRAAYLDPALSPEARAADLCGRLTLEEKSQLMRNGSPAIERLGIPAFDWWSEALHGVGRNGLATVFPSCIGMAASFDDDMIERVFSAVSDEARAKNTDARRNGIVGKYRCLSFWTPTVNVFRDPRWGRGQESYGEDPYMNGRMGTRVVRGLQGDTTHKYMKLLACAKHFAVHSGPEKTRHNMNIEGLPVRELRETYLPAFKALVEDAGVREVMCAYQRFEGEACCGSNRLLQQILRDEWGFDGMVVSDCGAINDFYLPKRHGVAEDAAGATALGVLSGTDVECGSVYKHLPEAVRKGYVSEEAVDVCVRRLLAERFRLGDFDPDSLVEWTRIPMSVIDCPEHRALALQAAREQMVLLKNDGVLPLKAGKRVMVVGPNAADSTMQWGIYYGQPGRTVTILQGLRDRLGADLPYMQACGITSPTERVSIFDRFTASDGTPGMEGVYWNNTAMAGDRAATVRYTSPVNLDNGGNTAFAPGVDLENFTLRLRGSFMADADEELDMIYNNDDGLRIIVNGDTVHERWKAEPLNHRSRKLRVEKGKRYDIGVDYMQVNGAATLNFDICRQRVLAVDEVVARTAGVDVVVFAGGISPAFEREQAKVREPGFDDGDRTSIELPAVQREILRALKAAGREVVLVNCSGSALALSPEMHSCDAILQAWYPGQEGGTAVAEVLCGDFNPCGKLPVTFYCDDAQLPAFDEYRMEGRTYRYLREEPLFPFGHGLSYTTYRYGKPRYADGVVTVEVCNTGKVAGTEIVQLYLRRPSDVKGPNKTLRGYERVELRPGERKKVSIPMPRNLFESWDEESESMRVIPGRYEVMVGPSSRDEDLKKFSVEI